MTVCPTQAKSHPLVIWRNLRLFNFKANELLTSCLPLNRFRDWSPSPDSNWSRSLSHTQINCSRKEHYKIQYSIVSPGNIYNRQKHTHTNSPFTKCRENTENAAAYEQWAKAKLALTLGKPKAQNSGLQVACGTDKAQNPEKQSYQPFSSEMESMRITDPLPCACACACAWAAFPDMRYGRCPSFPRYAPVSSRTPTLW